MPYFGIPIRNGLPIGLGSVAGFGVSEQFSPDSLFSAGEQGAWYDPSDLTTLFQDSAGGTPVTAVEQPVGRMLDKSGRGNHATQSTSTSRPVLRARYNLYTHSENLNQTSSGTWVNISSTVTLNSGTAPDNTNTANRLQGTASNWFVAQTPAVGTGASHIVSMYVKSNTGSPQTFRLFANGGGAFSGNFTATTDWQRFTFTFTPGTATSQCGISRDSSGNTADLLVWGAQLITTNSLPSNTYQRIVTATDYNSSGFLPYLAFDGTDDSLLTNSVDFTATDKMTVWAGVRKLSDAAQGVVSELSATIASNNGSFLLTAPNSAAANYNWSSKGTTQVDNTVTTYTAPITNVVTGIADIAGASNIIRINGVQVGSVATTQGTGNYGNYPLYIGRRNNATLPLNGNLYSLIIRGAQSSAAQISSTETWANGKTGAY